MQFIYNRDWKSLKYVCISNSKHKSKLFLSILVQIQQVRTYHKSEFCNKKNKKSVSPPLTHTKKLGCCCCHIYSYVFPASFLYSLCSLILLLLQRQWGFIFMGKKSFTSYSSLEAAAAQPYAPVMDSCNSSHNICEDLGN